MPKRQVLTRHTKQERKKERESLGMLRSQVVAPKTESRYPVNVSRFLGFLKEAGKSCPRSFLTLDRYLCEFIEELWHEGEPKGYTSDTRSGVGHFIPSAKPHMIAAWRLHAARGRAELPCRAPPFTPLVLYALAQASFVKGWADTAVLLLLLLLLGFHTFAGSGELFHARCKDSLCYQAKLGRGRCHFPSLVSVLGLLSLSCLKTHLFARLCKLHAWQPAWRFLFQGFPSKPVKASR